MSLHEYIPEIFNGEADARVLRALSTYRGKIFTIRELGRTAGVSHPEVSMIVRKLEKKSIVTIQPVGRALQVALNKDSYVTRSILEPMFAAERATVERIVSLIARFFKDKRIISVAIFGSFARGSERPESDIDLLIITPDRELALSCASRAWDAVKGQFGPAISPIVMTRAEFLRFPSSDLAKSILEEYIHVCGTDLKELSANE